MIPADPAPQPPGASRAIGGPYSPPPPTSGRRIWGGPGVDRVPFCVLSYLCEDAPRPLLGFFCFNPVLGTPLPSFPSFRPVACAGTGAFLYSPHRSVKSVWLSFVEVSERQRGRTAYLLEDADRAGGAEPHPGADRLLRLAQDRRPEGAVRGDLPDGGLPGRPLRAELPEPHVRRACDHRGGLPGERDDLLRGPQSQGGARQQGARPGPGRTQIPGPIHRRHTDHDQDGYVHHQRGREGSR